MTGLLLGALLLVGSARAVPGSPGVSVPLYAVDHACADPRYPTLAGPWVVACGPAGLVDRAISLASGQTLRLPVPSRAPGVGPAAVYVPGRQGGLWRLTEDGVVAVPEVTRVVVAPVAPPATDGTHLALLAEDSLQAFPATERSRRVVPAHPAGWQPPALAWPEVAWVEDAGTDGTDVWLRRMDGRAEPERLAGGPGDQGRVVAQGRWLAWVEPQAVVVLDLDGRTSRRIPAETGFSAPPALWEGEACWEVRTPTAGVDIACSDLPGVGGPGHQRWPARWGPWLLYREGDQVRLYTRPAPAE